MKKPTRLQNMILESSRLLNEIDGMPFDEEPVDEMPPVEEPVDASAPTDEPVEPTEGEGEFTVDTVKDQISAWIDEFGTDKETVEATIMQALSEEEEAEGEPEEAEALEGAAEEEFAEVEDEEPMEGKKSHGKVLKEEAGEKKNDNISDASVKNPDEIQGGKEVKGKVGKSAPKSPDIIQGARCMACGSTNITKAAVTKPDAKIVK